MRHAIYYGYSPSQLKARLNDRLKPSDWLFAIGLFIFLIAAAGCGILD